MSEEIEIEIDMIYLSNKQFLLCDLDWLNYRYEIFLKHNINKLNFFCFLKYIELEFKKI